jgi:hypothetical protein
MKELKRKLRSKSKPELLDIANKSGLTELETELVLARICQQHSRDQSAEELCMSYSSATDHFCNALKKIQSWYAYTPAN